jgi:diguanylate cyclase (GGDEF)-like protein
MIEMREKWEEIVDVLDFAFQPIVNIRTGLCIGFEALLRNWEQVGFSSIHEVFDWAFEKGFLRVFDLALREKAIAKFVRIRLQRPVKFFFNLDPRVVTTPEYKPGHTLQILERYGLSAKQVVLEISENHRIHSIDTLQRVLEQYRKQGFQLAIDDYGMGFAGPRLLYLYEPEYVKIPRFFIEGVDRDGRKKLFLINLAATSHTLGTMVIAEGVERNEEFYSCLDIGCDAVQGFLIDTPQKEVSHLKEEYEIVESLYLKNRRKVQDSSSMVLENLELLPTVKAEEPLAKVCELFRSYPKCRFFPVVNNDGEPLGVLQEEDFHNVIYAPYGRALLENLSLSLELFLKRCLVLEATTPFESFLSAFTLEENLEGIIVTQKGKYIGFLSPQSLLRIVYQKRLYEVQDQNPLTKLPGNTKIVEYLDTTLPEETMRRTYVYFDINHFKSFNDHYGFRRGDRVIFLFASLLREIFPESQYFVGHVGGDDFFVGTRDGKISLADCLGRVQKVLEQFEKDVQSFYDFEDRKRGYILGEDREGRLKKFPLLQAVAILLHLQEGYAKCTPDMLSETAACLKKRAKSLGIHCIIRTFPPGTKSSLTPESTLALSSPAHNDTDCTFPSLVETEKRDLRIQAGDSRLFKV